MDKPRSESVIRKRKIRRILWGVGAAVVLTVVTVALSQLEPAAPSVDRNMVWVETVKRGSMLRQVRGSGNLVPEVIQWIPARTEGRVEQIQVLPGTVVEADTVILELVNADLELSALDAESELRAAEATLASLRVQLQSQLLTQRSSTAAVRSEHRQAELQAEADQGLHKDGLIADLALKLSLVREEELARRAALEQERLDILSQSIEAQLRAQEANVAKLAATAEHRKDLVESLKVRAGRPGVLQQVPVEVGQRVTPGTNLARVADPTQLKAEVRIPETQARDITLGQDAEIDTRNGIIPGKVTRIDPAVQNGTVTVDVALIGELPRGARPDLTVDGTIELERLENVLYVGRPAFGQEESLIGLFKVVDEGDSGERTQVRLGRSSVTTVEIIEGLQEGDEVILSDMSQWDTFDRIRLVR